MNLINLPTFKEPGVVRCVVESPRGSAAKLRYDPPVKAFELARALPRGLTFPFDWGFVPSTMGEDGDPLDVMVIHDAATYPGLVVAGHLVAVLEVMQRDGDEAPVRNDRLFAVPVESHVEDHLHDVEDLSPRLREELETFFIASARLLNKKLELLGWKGRKTAERLVSEGEKAFQKRRG